MIVSSSTSLPFSALSSSKHLPARYTVYIEELQKRLLYVAFSFSLAFFCAYTERVALMYLITYPLQQALAKEERVDVTHWENILSQQERGSAWLASHSSANESLSTAFIQQLQSPIARPSGGVELIFTDVEEAFYTLLTISLFWCLLASLPVFLYHVCCFFQPGLFAWQSQRPRSLLSRTVLFVYLLLWLVHEHMLVHLLSFFYGFEIERASLCLHAEIKVVSYVSLYLFVYSATLLFCLLGVGWRFYTEKQIIHSSRACSALIERSQGCQLSGKHPAKPGFFLLRYQDQRSKLYWGCLLVSSILCPPEISSQLSCAFLLVLLNEASIWLAYISFCRAEYQRRA